MAYSDINYNNAIFRIRQVNYTYDSSVSSDNFEQVKDSLYYLHNNNYIAVDSEATFDPNIHYYTKSNWLQIPAIKGTSASISATPSSYIDDNNNPVLGNIIHIKNDNPAIGNQDIELWNGEKGTSLYASFSAVSTTGSLGEIIHGTEITISTDDASSSTLPYSFILWNGINGSGQVDSVDEIEPPLGSRNVQLNAVQYTRQTLSPFQQGQARENIGAAINYLETLTVNGVGIDNLVSEPSITLTASDLNINRISLGAADIALESLKVNGQGLAYDTSGLPIITLTSSDVGAATSWLELLTINGVGINDINSNPSITLTPNNLGISYDTALNSLSANPVQNSTLYNAFKNIDTKIVTVTLSSGNWSAPDSANPVYIQNIQVTGITVTANTKADIQAGPTTMLQMIDDGTNAMYVETYDAEVNESTVPSLRVYAIGEAPTADLTIQLSLSETNTIT